MKAIIGIVSMAALLVLASAASAQVVISEIHYHPVEVPAFNADGTPYLDLTDDVHEFVEIQNVGTSPVDLSAGRSQAASGTRFLPTPPLPPPPSG